MSDSSENPGTSTSKAGHQQRGEDLSETLSPAKRSVFNLQSAGPIPQELAEFDIFIEPGEWGLVWDFTNHCIKKGADGKKRPANYGALFQNCLLPSHPGLIYNTTRQPRIYDKARKPNVPFAQFWGFCAKKGADGKQCSTSYKLCLENIPCPMERVILRVTKSGTRDHSTDEKTPPVSRKLKGPIRALFASSMGTCSPSVMERNVYRTADPWDLADQVRPIGLNVAKNLKYEARQANFLSKEVMVDLDKRQQRLAVEFPEMPAPGYLQEIGYLPFHMPMFNSMQLHTVLKLARERKGLQVHIDATGSVLSKLDFFRHKAFLYTAVIEGPNASSTLSIFDFILDMHDWIRIRNRMSSYLAYLNACQDNIGVEIRPIMRITTDFSWALIKAMISAFNNFMSVGTYLNTVYKRTFNIPDDSVNTSNFYRTWNMECIVTMCYAHIMKSFSVNLTRKGVDTSSRRMALHCFADLIKSQSHQEFLVVFGNFIKIFGSKYLSSAVERSIECIKGDLEFDIDETVDEDRQAWYAEWETELVWEDSPTKQKKPLRVFTGFHEDLRKELEIYQSLCNIDGQNTLPNAYYSNRILDTFFSIYVPVIPLWAEFCFKFHGDFTTKTNGRSEGMFSYYKTHVFQNSRMAPGELVENLFQAVVCSYRKEYGMRMPTGKRKNIDHSGSQHKTSSKKTQNFESQEYVSYSPREGRLESEMWDKRSRKTTSGYGTQYSKKQKGFEKHGRLSVLRGSFNQADSKRFPTEQAGSQCTAIAGIALCYSYFHPICNWSTSDLDTILTVGDRFYTSKLGNKQAGEYLSASEVQGPVFPSISSSIGPQNLSLEIKSEHSGILLEGRKQFSTIKLLDVILEEFVISDDSQCILTASGYSYAIIKEAENVFLIDSHSRNMKAQPDPDGVAIVVKLPLRAAVDTISEILHNLVANATASNLQMEDVWKKFGCALTIFNVIVEQPSSSLDPLSAFTLDAENDSLDHICKVCNQVCAGGHKCTVCGFFVHAICGIGDADEEGYGSRITCYSCNILDIGGVVDANTMNRTDFFMDQTPDLTEFDDHTRESWVNPVSDSAIPSVELQTCCVCKKATTEINFCSVCLKFCHTDCSVMDQAIMEVYCSNCFI